MNNESNALNDLFAACWNDAALKQRFMQDPKTVLAEHGINVPADMDINVVENSDTCMNITMPALPFESYELSDEELSEVSGGGGFVAGMASGPPPTMGCGGSDDFRRRF